MKKLSTKEHWDSIYSESAADKEPEAIAEVAPPQQNSGNSVKSIIKRILGPKLLSYTENYGQYYLWDILFEKHLPKDKHKSIIEIGSAPGEFLVQTYNKLGFTPYGVEYTDNGALVNRKLFERNGINPDNVIKSDFFDSDFQDKYANYFDIVISRGFIEHFDNVEEVVNKHINILKPGGTLIISIPNFRKLNYLLLYLTDKELIPYHNFEIMDKAVFSRLFNPNLSDKSYCGYFGGFNFGLFETKRGFPVNFLLKIGHSLQPAINIVLRLFFGQKGSQNRYISPYLIYIGTKK